MDEEITALTTRGTWELMPCTVGATVVTCRWVYIVKYKADSSIDRYKVRLVARGFTQTYGIDYEKTFSPVARLNSIRVILSLALNNSWDLCQLDVKNAFLYDDLIESVLMEQSPGYVAQGEDRVCRLKKAIYGLKQSLRVWFEKFSQVVVVVGFQRCAVDHSVFYRKITYGCALLAVYIDDILVTGSDTKGIADIKALLQTHFVTKDMGKPRYFLSIEFAYANGKMALSQRKYILDLLQETGLLGCKPESTLIE